MFHKGAKLCSGCLLHSYYIGEYGEGQECPKCGETTPVSWEHLSSEAKRNAVEINSRVEEELMCGKVKNIEGVWEGEISGSNQGSIEIEVQQNHYNIIGKMSMDLVTYGYYTFNLFGFIDEDNILTVTATKDTKKFGPSKIRILAEAKSISINGFWINDLYGKGEFNLWKKS